MIKIRSVEFFASGKRRGVGKERRQHQERIQDQGALPEQTPAAPRRNAVSIDAGWRGAVSIDAGATLSLATMLAAGSTAEQSLDRHTMDLAQCVLMFLLLFFHAMSVAAAQVRVCVCVCVRERERRNFLIYYSLPLPPPSLRCGHKSYIMRSPYSRYA